MAYQRKKFTQNSYKYFFILSLRDSLEDVDYSKDMKEEIEQIKKNKAWTLVPRLEDKNVIGTKWIFRNKLDEYGQIV